MNNDIKFSAKDNIQKCIKDYLEETNESYIKFAKALGVSDTSVKRWVNGVCSPDIDLLLPICEHINVSIFELFGLSTNEDNLTNDEVQLLKLYASSLDFKTLVNKYRSDPSFKEHIDYIVNLQK